MTGFDEVADDMKAAGFIRRAQVADRHGWHAVFESVKGGTLSTVFMSEATGRCSLSWHGTNFTLSIAGIFDANALLAPTSQVDRLLKNGVQSVRDVFGQGSEADDRLQDMSEANLREVSGRHGTRRRLLMDTLAEAWLNPEMQQDKVMGDDIVDPSDTASAASPRM